MQGGPEVRSAPVSRPPRPAAGGRRRDGPERGPGRARLDGGPCSRTPGRPHGELRGGWGEFEAFREPCAEPRPFSRRLEVPGRVPTARRSRPAPQGGPQVAGPAAGPASEPSLSYENIFKFAFQEVPVDQAPEDICSLDHFLETGCGENSGLTSVPRLCSESRNLWRALQSTNPVSAAPCLWSKARCWENLFPVLGIDTAQKSLSGGQSHVLEGSDCREPEELLAVSSFHLHHCKALIQTKLSGTPGSRRGSLITYSLFLKTPLHGNGHNITIPRKKIFTPHNLKMAFFNNDVW